MLSNILKDISSGILVKASLFNNQCSFWPETCLALSRRQESNRKPIMQVFLFLFQYVLVFVEQRANSNFLLRQIFTEIFHLTIEINFAVLCSEFSRFCLLFLILITLCWAISPLFFLDPWSTDLTSKSSKKCISLVFPHLDPLLPAAGSAALRGCPYSYHRN